MNTLIDKLMEVLFEYEVEYEKGAVSKLEDYIEQEYGLDVLESEEVEEFLECAQIRNDDLFAQS